MLTHLNNKANLLVSLIDYKPIEINSFQEERFWNKLGIIGFKRILVRLVQLNKANFLCLLKFEFLLIRDKVEIETQN